MMQGAVPAVSAAFRFAAVSACLCLLLSAGCARQNAKTPAVEPDAPRTASEVADLDTVPQNLGAFVPDHSRTLRTDASAMADAARFRSRFFSPWETSRPDRGSISDIRAVLGWSRGHRGYAENLRPWSDAAWEAMRRNAAMGACPNMHRNAITVARADLRLAPTMRPRFGRIEGAGQGFPFDDFQQSALPPGTPVVIWHSSLDGAWLYASCAVADGWIQAEKVAWTDPRFESEWRSGSLWCFVKEDVPLSSDGAYLCSAGIGTVLPGRGGSSVLVPVRGRGGMAGITTASVPADSISPLPMRLTEKAVAEIGNRMMGRSYGWGGLFGDRDCSAMMKDLFAPFGIWLPRNSAAQGRSGIFTSLDGVPDSERESVILAHAVPFRTLLWLKGHIGLYVGEYKGRPVFFHNAWGVRNRLPGGGEGRIVIGRAVVTTLRPGAERNDVPTHLVSRLRGMAVIGG